MFYGGNTKVIMDVLAFDTHVKLISNLFKVMNNFRADFDKTSWSTNIISPFVFVCCKLFAVCDQYI